MTEQAEVVEDVEVIETEVMEEVRNLPAVRASEAIVARAELTVDEVVEQKDKIEQVMRRVMKEGTHYGVIPGVNKPSLLKPGAEAINVALRLAPHYVSEKIWHEDGHLTVVAKCELHHIPTGLVIGTGEGLCTTRESRYAFRRAQRVCPNCGESQIKRSKYAPKEGDYEGASAEDEPGWYCWKKEGGCGMNFAADDKRITEQEEGKVPNPDLADTYNTVLKMADKRALIAADLNATAASDIFTQDAEDLGKSSGGGSEGQKKEDKKPSRTRRKAKEIDPGKDLLEKAVKGAGSEAVGALQGDMRMLNDRVDWQTVVGLYTKEAFSVESARDLEQVKRDEWWLRLRNAVAKLAEIAHPELGASPEQIKEAFAWAFNGALIDEIPMLPEEEKQASLDDDIPFGGDDE